MKITALGLAALLASAVAHATVTYPSGDSSLHTLDGAVLTTGPVDLLVQYAADLDSGDYVVLSPLNVEIDEPEPEPIPDPDPEPTPGPTGEWRDALIPYVPAVGEIRRIPGTAITPVLLPDDGTPACNMLNCRKSNNVLNVWSGMSFDRERGILRIVAAGGHSDIGANSVYKFDISTLTWSRDFDYSQPEAPFPDYEISPEGRPQCVELEDGPYAFHTYDSAVYVPTRESTVLFRVVNYVPKGTYGCWWDDPKQSLQMWEWSDHGEYLPLPLDQIDEYHRTVYDADRDKIYVVTIRNSIYEVDPHTWEYHKIAYVWGGTGGVMTMEGRDVYYTAKNGGLYHVRIELDGSVGNVTKLAPKEDWFDAWGMDVSNGVVVGWDGTNNIYRYDTATGEYSTRVASGDTIPGDVTNGIYSKWFNVMPGVFIGISDNDGWVIYRDH